MKLSKIQMAVGVAIALAAGTASALPLSSIDGTEVKLYVSGATATDNGFANLMRLTSANGGLCVDGSLDSYEYAPSGGSANQRLNFCTGSANAGGAAGLKIMVAKESVSGSSAGISPVARKTNRDFLPFSLAALGTCESTGTTTSLAASGDFAAYTKHVCTSAQVAALASLVPTAGISDIDPATFVGLGGVIASDASSLTATSTVAVTFNPIVSLPMYRALQTAQGLTTDDSLANTPTLTLSQLRGILAGTLTNANKLWSRNNTTGNNAQVTAASTEIKICRRGNTSGTTASFKILFLGEGCSKNGSSIGALVTPELVYTNADGTGEVDPSPSGVVWSSTAALFQDDGTPIVNGYGGVRVFAGAASGDVRACVNYHSGAGNYAVGTASTESKPDGSNAFRYIRIDGVEPTLKAAMEGRYPYFTENTINRATSGSNVLAGNSLALYNAVVGQIGKASVLKAINSSWRDAASIGSALSGEADTGILDIPTASNNIGAVNLPVSNGLPRTLPINGQTRNYTGAANNCNMSRQLFP